MKTMLAPGDQLFDDTFTVEQVLEESVNPPLGQPGKTVKLSMRVEFVASYASEKDLAELASTVLNASMPEGFTASQEPLTYEPLNAYLTDERGVTRWSLRVSRQLEKQIDRSKVVPLVQGRNPGSATARLNSALGSAIPAEIQLVPAWWPWMPLIPFNITVEVR